MKPYLIVIIAVLMLLNTSITGWTVNQFDLQRWEEEGDVASLIEAMGDPDWRIAAYAADALVVMGEEAVPKLAASLRSNDDTLVFHASNALVEIGEVCVPELKYVITDCSNQTKCTIADIAGQIGTPSSLDILLTLIEDDAESVRLAAAKGMRNSHFGEAPVPSLVRHLDEENAEIVRACLDSLYHRGSEDLIQSYIELLSHEDDGVTEQAMANLVQIGEVAHADLLNTLSYAGPEVRFHIVWIIGESGNPDIVMHLCDYLQDPSAAVRHQIVLAMGKVGDQRCEACLIQALRDSEEIVRADTFWALSQIGAQNSYGLMELAIKEDVQLVAVAAIKAIGTLKIQEAEQLMIEQLYRSSNQRKYWAIWALGQLKSTRSVEDIIDIIERREEPLLLISSWALAEIGDERGIRSLQDLLLDPQVDQYLNPQDISKIRLCLNHLMEQR